jgi:hypothetical protein
MSKKLLIAISILYIAFATNSYSQTWCPPGATWYYTDALANLEGYTKLTYSKDTVINKIACKKITCFHKGLVFMISQGFYSSPFFTYSENGIAYLYNNKYGKHEFEVLFDMNAQIGDKWRIPQVDTACADSLYFMEVLDTGTKMVNGFNLKWLHVKLDHSPYFDTITERLGYRYDNFDYSPCHNVIADSPGGGLRCYSDNDFGLYSTKKNSSCDFITAISELQLNEDELKIYPNPANDKLTINLHFNYKQKATVDLYDLTGKLIRSNTLKEGDDELEISTATLSEGIYIYKSNVNGVYIKLGKLSIIH